MPLSGWCSIGHLHASWFNCLLATLAGVAHPLLCSCTIMLSELSGKPQKVGRGWRKWTGRNRKMEGMRRGRAIPFFSAEPMFAQSVSSSRAGTGWNSTSSLNRIHSLFFSHTHSHTAHKHMHLQPFMLEGLLPATHLHSKGGMHPYLGWSQWRVT